MSTATKEIRSFHPMPTRSDLALTNTFSVEVTREKVKSALRKVSLETIVNLLLWAVELYTLAFLLRFFLG